MNTPNQRFARNFRRVRGDLFLSGLEMGEFLGVSQQQINKYENARCHIPMRHIYKIAQGFDIDYDVFFETGQPEPTEQELSEKIISIRDFVARRRVLRAINALVD